MNLFRIFPFTLVLIPILMFFLLGRHYSTSNLILEILIEQNFSEDQIRQNGDIALPDEFKKNFSNKDFLAYFDNNISLNHKRFTPPNTISHVGDCCYLLYKENERNHEYYNNTGEKLFNIEIPGHPILSKDGSKIIFISTDGSSFSLLDRTQKLYVDNQYFDPRISAFHFADNENSFAIGSTSGKVSFFDFFGKEIFSDQLNDHKYPIIKSLAITSGTKRMLVVLSGAEPERLIFFEESTKNQKTTLIKKWDIETQEEVNKPIALHIDFYNGYIIKQSGKGFRRWKLSNGELKDSFSPIENDAPLINSLYKTNNGYLLVAFITAKQSQLWLFEADSLNILWQNNLPNIKLNDFEITSVQNNELYVNLQSNDEVFVYRLRNISK